MFKKVLAGVLATMMLVAPATSAFAEEAEDKFTVGVSWKTLQEERWVIELDEITKVCEEMGVEMIYQCSENDSQKQVGQIENLISQGVDMVIVMAPERAAMDNVLKEAHEAGVFVAYYEQCLGENYFDMSGGNDYFEVGQMITSAVAATGVSGDVAYLWGDSAGGTGVVMFREGMLDSMKDNDVNVIGEQFVTSWDPAVAMSYTENWLSEYGDSIKAVLCMNDGMAGGAVQALANEGLDGEVLVCGQDCDLAACQRIIEGTQYSTVVKGGRAYARAFTETAIKLAQGELTAEDFDMTDTNSLGEEKPFMSFPATVVTKDNLDEVVIDGGIYTYEEVYGEAAAE